MIDGCDFMHPEGFCEYEGKCKHQEGTLKICTAKPEDLIEICEDCDKPVTNCDCGTNWIMAHTQDGKIVLLTPKDFNKIKLREA